MNKFSKLAFIAATAVVAASASAQSVPASRQATNDNWVNGTGEYVWMNGTNELCWRDAFWTPATANAKCDGALVAQAPTPPAPAAAAAPALTSEKVTYQADSLFDFDKAVLKPAGKEKLDDLASKIEGMNVEVVVATGYTDKIGSDKYNDRLSLRRVPMPITLAHFAAQVEQTLGREPLLIGDADAELRRIAWCTGGAQHYFEAAIDAGADVYLSGEISEQTTHIANESGVAYLAAGHHATERYGVQALGAHLSERFDIEHLFIDIDNPV